ncbi:hypothetical protein GPECTOR_59g685 [Gonium pectorale]|uniref:Uncharacterized protein n=1 Tax=Gonium pectorale TaxID=33097 RepID=A0A150G5B3_GONPE|nr:hypothetical protein GPECTOR_59g685 [Gonium pectorale]|eukprot:KXZ45076.1 hypothetical protein GPECTOR_59g685 [Gonium pectorale]
MGQFYSREFDGDPYIDLMRSLPERELVWWAQKVIWLAEGYTFVDHFVRTYPRLFQHRCAKCKGAGLLTCPACAGTKVPLGKAEARQRRPALALASAGASGASTELGRLAGVDASGQCRLCGHGCSWDAESEWGERWAEWESRLAYYDKATGPLMDEWYEDVINAGNLEEDTAPAEDEPPGPEVPGAFAADDRQLAKDKKRMTAVMKRFGHPYDGDATLGYQASGAGAEAGGQGCAQVAGTLGAECRIVDPTASIGENIWNMAQVYNSTPPELNPLRTKHLATEPPRGVAGALAALGFPAAGVAGPGAVGTDVAAMTALALDTFDKEIAMEAALLQNLEAAAQDLPKPHRLGATAGTVLCDECSGSAWGYSMFPNTQRLFGIDRPLWSETVARLQKYWTPSPRGDPLSSGQLLPYGEHGLRSLLEAAAEDDPLAAIAGRKPETTERYRRDLELLVAHPELRDSRLQLPGAIGSLGDYVGARAGAGAGASSGTEEGGRDIADVAAPLKV